MKMMKAFDIFCVSPASTAVCFCLENRSLHRRTSGVMQSEHERKRLLDSQGSRVLEIRSNGRGCHRRNGKHGTAIEDLQTTALHQKAEVVVLRVSIHCQGCARKVRKHITKMEGVTSFAIDLEKKKVTVIGAVSPTGVLESISKVKNAEFWPCSSKRS